jgi:AcrR family transcriptional regulator
MKRRPRTAPKKAPQQERSRATVEALIGGTARVLVREGYARTTTNRIARAAGVNIGSLYQYFPGKEALVAALIDRHLRDIGGQLAARLAGTAGQPLDDMVRALVSAHLELHARSPALQRTLLRAVPAVDRLEPTRELRAQAMAMVRALLESRRDQLRAHADLDLTAFVVVSLIDALTQAAILERPGYLHDPAYAEEASQVVLRYLSLDAPAQRS